MSRQRRESRTVGQWRSWAESRLMNADGYVEQLRADARGAIGLASTSGCVGCTVRITVPVSDGRYRWEAAFIEHELWCKYQ